MEATLDLSESHANPDVYTNQCHTCKTKWPLPREIHWSQAAPDGLLQIKPTTTDTIVVCQTFDRKSRRPLIPSSVYERFTFATDGELVAGVRYDKRTEENVQEEMRHQLEDHPQDEKHKNMEYLRLVTLNNWYWALLNAFLSVGFLVSEFQSNAMLSASFMSDDILIDALGLYRFAFIALWLSSNFMLVYYAYREASLEWLVKSHPAKGDLISDCGYRSRMCTFMAMIVFELCLIEKDVKDIVIALHPWKGVQDFSAFKSEGHRAFFVGFRSKTMHRIENRLSIWHCLPHQVLTRLVVMGFKVYLIVVLFKHGERRSFSYSLLASASVSVGSVLWDSWTLIETYNMRSKFFKRLVARLTKATDTSSKQFVADIRMLTLHFRLAWDQTLRRTRKLKREELQEADWVSSGHVSQQTNGYCNACGRCTDSPRECLESLDLQVPAQFTHRDPPTTHQLPSTRPPVDAILTPPPKSVTLRDACIDEDSNGCIGVLSLLAPTPSKWLSILPGFHFSQNLSNTTLASGADQTAE